MAQWTLQATARVFTAEEFLIAHTLSTGRAAEDSKIRSHRHKGRLGSSLRCEREKPSPDLH